MTRSTRPSLSSSRRTRVPRCTSAGRSSSIRFPGRDPDAAATRGPARGALWHPAALPLPPLGASRPGLRRPSWVEDPGFAFANHLGRATLPAPGSRAELHEWLEDFWSHKLDRTRPLWEMTRVDGLEGRWMLATKTHHPWSTASGSSTSVTFCWTPSPGRPLAGPPRKGRRRTAPPLRPAQLAQPGAAARIARAGLDVVRHRGSSWAPARPRSPWVRWSGATRSTPRARRA